MISNIYSQKDSPILLALFVQNPDLDVPQTIYGRESYKRGTLREITTGISLKTFLENQPLSPSGKWYEVVKKMIIPRKDGKHPIHFWIPRDQDLKIGVLNQELVPIQDQTGVMQCIVFHQPNQMRAYSLTQLRLDDIFQKGQSDLASSIFSSSSSYSDSTSSSSSSYSDSTSSSSSSYSDSTSSSSSSYSDSTSSSDSDELFTTIDELPSIPSSTFANSRGFVRRSPRITSSSNSPTVTSTSLSMHAVIIPETQPSVEIRQCNEIFVKEKNVYVSQPIYVMMNGKLQEITVASLQYLLQKQPRTRAGDAIECVVILDDSPIHFHLPIKSNLSIAVLDSKLMPIKDRYERHVTLGLTHLSSEVSDEKLERIQGHLDRWPQQYRRRKIGSASDPLASFRTAPPASKMRPIRTTSGQLSATGVQSIKWNDTITGSSSDVQSIRSHSDPGIHPSISSDSTSTITRHSACETTSEQIIKIPSIEESPSHS